MRLPQEWRHGSDEVLVLHYLEQPKSRCSARARLPFVPREDKRGPDLSRQGHAPVVSPRGLPHLRSPIVRTGSCANSSKHMDGMSTIGVLGGEDFCWENDERSAARRYGATSARPLSAAIADPAA